MSPGAPAHQALPSCPGPRGNWLRGWDGHAMPDEGVGEILTGHEGLITPHGLLLRPLVIARDSAHSPTPEVGTIL